MNVFKKLVKKLISTWNDGTPFWIMIGILVGSILTVLVI